jgi:nicotinate-nucleotide adenylyltransferase
MIGIFGGTFDPVHNGHTHAALAVAAELGLSSIHMLLSARPGHRAPSQTSNEHRWQMLQLACAAHSNLIADDSELNRPGTSYTFDTLAAMAANKSSTGEDNSPPVWILGHDSFATLTSWYRWNEISNLCNLVVLDRPGQMTLEDRSLVNFCAQRQREKIDHSRAGQMLRLPLPMQEVSATFVRQQLGLGQSVSDLLAPAVSQYIEQHQLYITTESIV